MPKINKILVTGATSFVGANLVRKLVGQNYQIHIITRSSSDKWRIKDILPRVKEHSLDLTEKDKVKRLVRKIKPEIIFHLAAAGVYGGIETAKENYLKNNFISTVNLLDACSEINYQAFINTGSSSEYGPKISLMKESDSCQPINFYGLTKLASTLYASMIGRTENKPIVTFRIFSPYGSYDEPKRLISSTIINTLENRDLSLADPQGVRDYIYIEDVIDLYLKSVDKAFKAKGEIFNLGSGRQKTVSEIVDKVIRLTNSKNKINWGVQKTRPWDTKRWQADIKKTSQFFNWRPQYSISQGLKKTVNWFRDNLNLYK